MISHSDRYSVVIAGAGFSGTMLAVNLIRYSPIPMHIRLVDRSGEFAKGLAYSTTDPVHLLNIIADRMGAFSDNPKHFFEWLSGNEALWRYMDESFPSILLDPKDYPTRKLYGIYMENLLAEAEKEAATKGILLEKIKAIVSDADIIEEKTRIESKRHLSVTIEGAAHKANALVLAVGNFPSKTFDFEGGLFDTGGRYMQSIWRHSNAANNILAKKDLSYLSENEPIIIIGTGLTMVDAVMSLNARNYRGNIIAISRNGQLPKPHKVIDKPYPPFLTLDNAPTTALEFYQTIKNEVTEAEKHGYDWRAVIDSLRQYTPIIFHRLPVEEKREFMDHFYPWWNVHRHRIPEKTHMILSRLIQEGKLEVVAGNILHVGGTGDNPLSVTFRRRKEDTPTTMIAGYVMNCSGPELDIAKSRNPLLLNLRDKGMVTVSPLRIGIGVTDDYRAKGTAPDLLHAIGPILMGEYLETTAVAELRVQVENLAKTIISAALGCSSSPARTTLMR